MVIIWLVLNSPVFRFSIPFSPSKTKMPCFQEVDWKITKYQFLSTNRSSKFYIQNLFTCVYGRPVLMAVKVQSGRDYATRWAGTNNDKIIKHYIN